MSKNLLYIVGGILLSVTGLALAISLVGLITLNAGHGDGSNPRGFLFFGPLDIVLIGLCVWLGLHIKRGHHE